VFNSLPRFVRAVASVTLDTRCSPYTRTITSPQWPDVKEHRSKRWPAPPVMEPEILLIFTRTAQTGVRSHHDSSR
jgi:hypothetical protein